MKIFKSKKSLTLPGNFFLRFQLYQMLGIVPSYNIVQYQGKLMMQP